MEWFIKCIKQYADFKGRARRKEFWMFTLFCTIFNIAAMLIDVILWAELPIFETLFSLFIFIPSLAVGIRRLHDIGKSGWMWLIAFIPIVGAIWLLILWCKDGEPGTNKWGDNPKE
ncbi:MAG: DUF805 domain-containing protein [Bacteroidales bacterium]|nr:DUF805 domain-containing protein [Bacteroidales bacterium]